MLEKSPLGKKTEYKTQHTPSLLFAIARRVGRDALELPEDLPFSGADLWTGYELSWLNAKGKPQVAAAEFIIPAESKFLIESKSLKLYFNSLNGTRFASKGEVESCIRSDMSKAADCAVGVQLFDISSFQTSAEELDGECLDDLDVSIDTYEIKPEFLTATGGIVEETLRSNLLKSNCPVTGQPDWAAVMVRYTGPKIDRTGLVKYIVSFRDHSGFHEQCVEKIFLDIKARCRAERLTVYARYTRRGGLDINPFRSDFEDFPTNCRTFRQ
jgi:7-cyano-7-deazaguanine reductase